MRVKQQDQTVQITTDTQTLLVTVVQPLIVRVQFGTEPSVRSYAITSLPKQTCPFTVTEDNQQVIIRTTRLKVAIDANLHIDVYDQHDQPLVLDYRGERTPLVRKLNERQAALSKAEGHANPDQQTKTRHQVIKKLHEHDHLYGLGDKTGFLDKRGYAYDNWNTDNPAPQVENFTKLYKSVPFILGLTAGRAYGLFFDTTWPSHFDLGKENTAYYVYTTEAPCLAYYIFGGTDLAGVLTAYTALTGRTPLPQKWTLGYHQSRWSYDSEDQVTSLAKKMRAEHLPGDAIHLDIDYMDGYRIFTIDQQKFPDFVNMAAKLKKAGFKLVTIIDPGIKKDRHYAVYQSGIKEHTFVTTPTGQVYENTVWPGTAVFPDFGRQAVRRWWADQLRVMVQAGVTGIWNDMNEPASFSGDIPNDIVFYDEDKPATHRQMHNVYGHNMARATYAGLKSQTQKRPFIISRAVYAGSQKYTTVWTGDNHSLWVHLQWLIPQLCNLGLSGFSFAGTDIGGFASDTTPELLIRWLEAGIFSPLLRNHNHIASRAQEPWQFGQRTLAIYRSYLELRYHLLDYLYTLFARGEQDGLPIMRPLVLHYQDDPRTWTMNDEYLVGEQLLVAPVVMPSTTKRLVYLPAGTWLDFWTGRSYAGQQDHIIDAPLDHLPLFVKANSILPWRPLTQSVDVAKEHQISFKVYGETGEYRHYQDNGSDFAYRHGAYNEYLIQVQKNRTLVQLLHAGYAHPYDEIKVEKAGQEQKFVYQPENGTYQQVTS